VEKWLESLEYSSVPSLRVVVGYRGLFVEVVLLLFYFHWPAFFLQFLLFFLLLVLVQFSDAIP
jgi:hypothetical protein